MHIRHLVIQASKRRGDQPSDSRQQQSAGKAGYRQNIACCAWRATCCGRPLATVHICRMLCSIVQASLTQVLSRHVKCLPAGTMIVNHRPSILKRPLRPNGNMANEENQEKEYQKEQVRHRLGAYGCPCCPSRSEQRLTSLSVLRRRGFAATQTGRWTRRSACARHSTLSRRNATRCSAPSPAPSGCCCGKS